MALTPAACDPKREDELKRIKGISKNSDPSVAKGRLKQEFNIDLDEQTNLEIKKTETKDKK